MSSKMGRPVKTDSGNRTVNTSFTIDPPLLKALDDICHRERRSKSDIVNEILGQFVKDHSNGNDSCKIDGWVKDPQLQAMPNLMASKEAWASYIKKQERKHVQKIIECSQFLISEGNLQLGNFKQQEFEQRREEEKAARLK